MQLRVPQPQICRSSACPPCAMQVIASLRKRTLDKLNVQNFRFDVLSKAVSASVAARQVGIFCRFVPSGSHAPSSLTRYVLCVHACTVRSPVEPLYCRSGRLRFLGKGGGGLRKLLQLQLRDVGAHQSLLTPCASLSLTQSRSKHPHLKPLQVQSLNRKPLNHGPESQG